MKETIKKYLPVLQVLLFVFMLIFLFFYFKNKDKVEVQEAETEDSGQTEEKSLYAGDRKSTRLNSSHWS